jgi:hypothetical protein
MNAPHAKKKDIREIAVQLYIVSFVVTLDTKLKIALKSLGILAHDANKLDISNVNVLSIVPIVVVLSGIELKNVPIRNANSVGMLVI